MKTMLALTLLAALAVTAPTIAQGPPPGGPGGPGPGGPPQAGAPPDSVLKDVLGLSDDQLTALKAALDARRQAADALTPQLMDAEKALAEALKAGTSDAGQLGTLLLKVQAVRAQLDQVGETFKAAFAKVLTAAQQQKVADVLALQKSLQAGQALQQLGL